MAGRDALNRVPDDVTLMRAAREIAARIRHEEAAAAFPVESARLRPARLRAEAVTWLIDRQREGHAPPLRPELAAAAGSFEALVADFLSARARGESTLTLYERMQGPGWTEPLRERCLFTVERLWAVLELVGLTLPGVQGGPLEQTVAALALQHTVACFAGMPPNQIDATTAAEAVGRLVRFTRAALRRTPAPPYAPSPP